MNIVFIGPFGLQPIATMSVRALSLARALVARGHLVTVLIPPWDDPARAGQRWEEVGVQVVNVPLPPGLPLLFHLWLTWSLVRETLARRPDVVHFFKPKAYAGLAHLALWGLRRLGRVSLRLVLDSDDWEQAWNEVSSYSTAQKRFFAWQEKWGLGHADAITVASRGLAPLAGPYAGQRPLFYVPNGRRETSPPKIEAVSPATVSGKENGWIKEATDVRRRWKIDEAPAILLFTRFAEFRLERIVTLVRLVAAQVPEARWLIVGAGLHGEEQALAALLEAADLAECVRFTGWLPAEALPACFQAVDIAVHPYDDTLINRTKCSVRLLDLLAAGLPVVADAVGQNCEYIESGVSGLLVPAENDGAFSEAIITLIHQPGLRRRLGQTAQARVRDTYSWARLSQIVEEAYA